MKSPSDHLLRTLAAVPVSSHILDFGCGAGGHTEALLRLGFPVHACDVRPDAVEQTRARIEDLVGEDTVEQCVQVVDLADFDVYPADAFDWVVAVEPTAYVSSDDDLPAIFAAVRRLLKPGGWVYVALHEGPLATNGTPEAASRPTPDRLTAHAQEAGLAVSMVPERADEHGTPLVRGIFRRVEAGVPR